MSNFFNKTPYTDFHELNLDWLLERVNNIKDHVKGMQDDIIYLQEHTPDMDDYYDKTETDALLADKADVSDLPDMTDYYDKTETDALLADKADVSDLPDMTDYYDKTETDNLLSDKADISSLATVATTGDYDDLINTPTIPAAQVNSDWNANSGVAQILNKPTIPTVNDGTLTINVNSVSAGTFTANQSTNDTINISCEPPLNWNTPNANQWNYYIDGKGYRHYFRHYKYSSLNFNVQEGAVWLASLDNWTLNYDYTKLIYANITTQCPNKLVGAQFHSFDNVNHKFYTYYYGFTQGAAPVDLYIELVFMP